MSKKIRLGVNLDHIATMRQVRGNTTPYPDMLLAYNEAIAGGAEQITIHLREDRRHIQEKDLKLYAKQKRVALNLEMGATKEMHGMAIKYRPEWVCLVPEKRKELTTEGGLDVAKLEKTLKPYIASLKAKGIKISLFIAPLKEQVEAAARLNADAIELHTGHWVLYKSKHKAKEWKSLVEAANLSHKLGVNVHAGHGLDIPHTEKICQLPHLQELNIGHAIICESLFIGLKKSVRNYKKAIKESLKK